VIAEELAPDLWRWTGRRETIGADVSCVYYKTGRAILLFDPLLPPEDPEGFWKALDRDVLPIDAYVHVLVTRPSHTRSAREMLDRYPGARLWATEATRAAVEERAGTVTDTFAAGCELPGGVIAHQAGRPGEVLFWLPEHRALVVGDVLAGNGAGGLQLTRPEDAEALRPLLELAVELVVPSHGEPARDGAAALRAALGG
jgi:glyoxylase-like metal-dependent hydrolase (beta-lactamase superfamily II)